MHEEQHWVASHFLTGSLSGPNLCLEPQASSLIGNSCGFDMHQSRRGPRGLAYRG